MRGLLHVSLWLPHVASWRELVGPLVEHRQQFPGGCHWHVVVEDDNLSHGVLRECQAEARRAGCVGCVVLGLWLGRGSWTQVSRRSSVAIVGRERAIGGVLAGGAAEKPGSPFKSKAAPAQPEGPRSAANGRGRSGARRVVQREAPLAGDAPQAKLEVDGRSGRMPRF